MKWYTCCNEAGLVGGGDCLIAAVHSCLAHTRLRPHLVYDGAPNALTRYLESRGVRVIHHALSFKAELEAAHANPVVNLAWLIGSGLRFDLAGIEREDAYILYTDTDVIFHADPALDTRDVAVAAAAEILERASGWVEADDLFNAGVMLLNTRFMGALYDVFRKACVALARGEAAYPMYDQSILNGVLAGTWTRLPQSLNCRPYHGCPGSPVITHLQFVKPNMIAPTGALRIEAEPEGRIFRAHRPAYRDVLDAFNAHLPGEAVAQLRASCPAARIAPSTMLA